MTGDAAVLIASLCLVLTGCLGALFVPNPARGQRAASHWPDQLPLVMSDRHIGTTVVILGVILWGDLWLLASFLAVLGLAGLGGVLIHARAGHPVAPRAVAAALHGVAALLAFVAHLMNGTA